MRAVKSRDTGPELAVRAICVRSRPAIGSIAPTCRASRTSSTPARKLAIFVHGCFWHGHDCPRGARPPKANADYWRAKIARNRARDAATLAAYARLGWRALSIHECELKDPAALSARLAAAFVAAPRTLSAPLAARSRPDVAAFGPCTKYFRSATSATPRPTDAARWPLETAIPTPQGDRRTTRKGRAAARRHPPARPHARRHRARAGGRGGLSRSSSASARPRSASIATTRSARGANWRRCSTASTPTRLWRSCAPSAISRISPISPKTSITSAATAPMSSRARRRAPARSPTPFNAPREAGVDAAALRDFFDGALVSPVLTAHPTEVRRKSTLTRELEIARTDRRARPLQATQAELARNEERAAPRDPHALAHQHAAPDAS